MKEILSLEGTYLRINVIGLHSCTQIVPRRMNHNKVEVYCFLANLFLDRPDGALVQAMFYLELQSSLQLTKNCLYNSHRFILQLSPIKNLDAASPDSG